MGGQTAPGNDVAEIGTRNEHRELLLAAFGQLRPRVEFVTPEQDYLFVLFTNRCGSNYLCEVLASTGRFNEGGEFFNAHTIIEHAWARRLRGVQEYFAILPALVGAQERLLAKLAIEHVDILSEAAILPAILPRSRFILLERQDWLGQAMSRVIAAQNRQWTSLQSPVIAESDLVYARAAIEGEARRVADGTARLRRFLADSGAVALHVESEALLVDPQAQITRIGDWLGLENLRFNPAAIRLARQAGAVNRAWRERYLRGE